MPKANTMTPGSTSPSLRDGFGVEVALEAEQAGVVGAGCVRVYQGPDGRAHAVGPDEHVGGGGGAVGEGGSDARRRCSVAPVSRRPYSKRTPASKGAVAQHAVQVAAADDPQRLDPCRGSAGVAGPVPSIVMPRIRARGGGQGPDLVGDPDDFERGHAVRGEREVAADAAGGRVRLVHVGPEAGAR